MSRPTHQAFDKIVLTSSGGFMEGRRLACDRRYRERLRQLNMLFSRAA